MTVSYMPSAMPIGDATPKGPDSGAATISARAHEDRTTGPEPGTPDVTERIRALRDDRAARVAAAASPKEAASAQWAAIRHEIELFATLGTAFGPVVAQTWTLADRRLRDLREAVAAEVTIRVAEVEMRSNIQMVGDGTYPTYDEKVTRRRENRDRYWAETYAEQGGSPDRDATLTWSRIGSEVAKLRRHDLDEDDLWLRIGGRLRDLHVDVSALLDEAVAS